MLKEPAHYCRRGYRLLASLYALTVWSWASKYGVIPPEESGKPGPWLPERARLFRHALEVITARLTGRDFPAMPHAGAVRFVIICGPSQIGKTKSFLHPILAYCIDVLRTNCAFLTHKQKQIRQHLKARLLPMFELTPRLARYLPQSESLRRERLAGSLWQLEGANLHALCANVASDLREYSHMVGIMDEPEAYALNVDGEGDPIELFLDRQKRYPENSILAGASTPNTVQGHTWAKLCTSLHLRLMVRCQHCGHDQDLSPDGLRATDQQATPDEIDEHDLALWHCAACDHGHTSSAVDAMVRAAEAADRWIPGTWAQDDDSPAGAWLPGTVWRRQADGEVLRVPCATWAPQVDPDTGEILADQHQVLAIDWPVAERLGYHMHYLHDDQCSNGRFLAHELRARHGSAQEWHTHVTGWRAEPIIVSGTMLDTAAIESSTGSAYRWQTCPADARWLLIVCDQQGNTPTTAWFAYEVRAVQPGGESYLVDAGRVDGFAGLRELETREYLVGGRARRCDRIAVDGANGNLARELRSWAVESYHANQRAGMDPATALQRVRRVILIGDEKLAPDQPWREREPTQRDRILHPLGCRIFRWNHLHWKDRAHRRLAGDDGLPALHIPIDDAVRPKDLDRYLRSCTSEERVVRAIGMPGGRQRHGISWQARVYTDPHGNTVERSDTHWWDACCMMDVLCDLVGVYILPGAAAPAEPPKDATLDQLKEWVDNRAAADHEPPENITPKSVAQRYHPRRHSRLNRRR